MPASPSHLRWPGSPRASPRSSTSPPDGVIDGSAADHVIEAGERGGVAVVLLEGTPRPLRRLLVGREVADRRDEALDVAVAKAPTHIVAADGLVHVAALGTDVDHGKPGGQV